MSFTQESLQAAADAVLAEVKAICASPAGRTQQPRKSDVQFDSDAEQEGGAR
jgi:hypothetical protein